MNIDPAKLDAAGVAQYVTAGRGRSAMAFLLAWELMSVSSYFLVMTESADPDTRQAGLWYIAMTQFSLVMLLPMFLLSSTFFPITVYPEGVQWVIQALPLWHGIELVRGLTTAASLWVVAGIGMAAAGGPDTLVLAMVAACAQTLLFLLCLAGLFVLPFAVQGPRRRGSHDRGWQCRGYDVLRGRKGSSTL